MLQLCDRQNHVSLYFQYLLWPLVQQQQQQLNISGNRLWVLHIALEECWLTPLHRTASTLGCWWVSSHELLTSGPSTTFQLDWGQEFVWAFQNINFIRHWLFSGGTTWALRAVVSLLHPSVAEIPFWGKAHISTQYVWLTVRDLPDFGMVCNLFQPESMSMDCGKKLECQEVLN